MDTSFLEPLADPRLFVPFFVVTWVLATAGISVVGGWRQLGHRFPAVASPEGETFSFVSGALITGILPVGYGNCLFVTIGKSGVRLSILFPFRLLHPPLMIPWTAIESVRRERYFFHWRAVVRIRDFDRRLALYGRAGERVADAYERLAATAPGGGLVAHL